MSKMSGNIGASAIKMKDKLKYYLALAVFSFAEAKLTESEKTW